MDRKRRFSRVMVVGLTLIFMLTACLPFFSPGPKVDTEWVWTAAVKTWQAKQTEIFLSSTPSPTLPPPTDTPLPTDTPTATFSLTPTNTFIPPLTPWLTNTLPPTFTPTRTSTPIRSSGGGGGGGGTIPTPTPGVPCYRVEFVRDVTIPNGEPLRPGTVFIKTWLIKNTGSCPWPTGAKMVPASSRGWTGDPIPINQTVRPGKTVQASIELTAPALPPGSDGENVTGNFVLRIKKGVEIKPSNQDYFKVRIRVADIAAGVVWDFVGNACSGTWKNSRDRLLPCPGREGDRNGFVKRLSPAKLEDGISYTAALWTHPLMQTGGKISGSFPYLLIQTGDRLRIQVGCIFNFANCDVSYNVFYQVLGENKQPLLASAHTETYDGVLHTIFDEAIDDDFLNKYVSFTFQVTSLSSPAQSAAAWLVLQIYR